MEGDKEMLMFYYKVQEVDSHRREANRTVRVINVNTVGQPPSLLDIVVICQILHIVNHDGIVVDSAMQRGSAPHGKHVENDVLR